MTRLAPDLFTRRFQDFLEIGQTRLHPLAPEWTDYNAHDPGITLMELLAWTAEAQLYSLSRMRRDERAAYASLVGVEPRGARPASGVIWPDPTDPLSPVATYSGAMVLLEDSPVNLPDTVGPYRTVDDLLWVPGAIQSLTTRQGAHITDLTTKNRRGQVVFFPFGQGSAKGNMLSVSFRCNGDAGVFGLTSNAIAASKRRGALWPIGVLAADDATDAPADDAGTEQPSPLTASLVVAGERFPISIASDTSQGMLTTGVLMLDLSGLPGSPAEFTIEFRALHGLVRPPRVLRIEPNVIPIVQGQIVVDELHDASGLPDLSFALDLPGLQFEPGTEPVQIETAGSSGRIAWHRCDQLSHLGPTDLAFEFNPVSGLVTFGNGINGKIPEADAQVLANYRACDGDAGNIAPNRRWIVGGIQGIYGTNLVAVAGGSNAPDGTVIQHVARRRVSVERPLVTSADIVGAAKKIPLLEVGRAWVLDPDSKGPHTGITTLVAMRMNLETANSNQPSESPAWLRAVREDLAPRIPLGTRLAVIAPQYVGFTVAVSIETQRGENPEAVKAGVEAALRARFELIPLTPTATVLELGESVSRRDVAAQIRAVDGVGRIVNLRLTNAFGTEGDISVPSGALARFDLAGSQVDVSRPSRGGGA